MIRFVLPFMLYTCVVHAQDSSANVALAETGLVAELAPLGTWDMTRSADQIVMQCTDCDGSVIVVVRQIPDYVDGTPFALAQQLYDAGRHQLCSELVAQRQGRCLGDGVSVEQGLRIYEYVVSEGRDLLAGYVSAPDGTAYTALITPILRDAVDQLRSTP